MFREGRIKRKDWWTVCLGKVGEEGRVYDYYVKGRTEKKEGLMISMLKEGWIRRKDCWSVYKGKTEMEQGLIITMFREGRRRRKDWWLLWGIWKESCIKCNWREKQLKPGNRYNANLGATKSDFLIKKYHSWPIYNHDLCNLLV